MLPKYEYNNNFTNIVKSLDSKIEPIVQNKKSKKINTISKFIILFLILITISFGCQGTGSSFMGEVGDPIPTVNETQENVKNIKDDVENTKDGFKETTESIEEKAKKGKDRTPETSKEDLWPLWDGILSETSTQWILIERLDSVVLDLNKTQDKLKDVENQVSDLKGAYKDQVQKTENAEKRIEELESSVNNQIVEKYIWISVASFAGLVISIALALMWTKKALVMAVICAISLILSIALLQTFQYFWIIAVVGIGLASVYLIWELWVNKKAVKELVKTGELAKKELDPEKKKKIFGDGPEPGVVNQIQSNGTKGIVKNVRKSLDKSERFES